MDPVFDQLFIQIRAALSSDAPDTRPLTGSLTELLPNVRDALRLDEVSSSEDDVALAAHVSDALPRLLNRLRVAYTEARAQIERDYPWTLPPLDWQMDLLAGLGKERSEVTHTQCLAHLFDGKAAHGLGTRALREFFRLLGRLIPGEDIFESLAASTPESAERLRHVRVFAEQRVEAPIGETTELEDRRCDLWLELVEEGRALVIVIENKIDASEHDAQLASYEQAVWKWARRHRRNSFEQRLVLLTPDGRGPEDVTDHEAWLPVSYRQLAACLAQAACDAPEPGRTFLSLYVSTILKTVLGVVPHGDETDHIRRLPYLRELIAQGVGRE